MAHKTKKPGHSHPFEEAAQIVDTAVQDEFNSYVSSAIEMIQVTTKGDLPTTMEWPIELAGLNSVDVSKAVLAWRLANEESVEEMSALLAEPNVSSRDTSTMFELCLLVRSAQTSLSMTVSRLAGPAQGSTQ